MKSPDQPPHFRFVRFLVAGFALLVCLLIASAFVAFQGIQSIERNTSRLMAEQSASSRLVDALHREEDALSAVFYALVSSRGPHPAASDLLRRLDEASARIQATTEAGIAAGKLEGWRRTRLAANNLIAELRRTLIVGEVPSARHYVAQQELVDLLSDLATQSYQLAVEAQQNETERTQTGVTRMLALLSVALVTAVFGAILAIRSALRILRTMQWQTQELARLSSRTMSVQEETARRFSRELHDQFGQTLTAIEANLAAMRNGEMNEARIGDCLALVKEAMGDVRQISQLLRPSVLDDFGLDASLSWLAETFAQRTGVRVDYESTFSGRLSDDVETQLFRIAQEALTNVARHSDATRVRIGLSASSGSLSLTIADNGRGLPDREAHTGTGLISMRARAGETGANLSIKSGRGQGVTIRVELPLNPERDHATENTHLVGR